MNPDNTTNTSPNATSFPSAGSDSTPAFAQTPASFSQSTATDDDSGSTTSTVTTTSSSGGGGGGGSRRRVIMIAIAMVMMLSGLASGAYLITRNEPTTTVAWDCALYVFDVSPTGEVTVQNGSVRDLPAQVAKVYIDELEVAEFEVPALNSGEAQAIGTVTVPENGLFNWRVEGNKDCDTEGTYEPTASAECLNVKAFDADWEPLSPSELSALEEGDIVRFTISGLTTQGTFEMARFTINGELSEEVSDKRPDTDEFYIEYEIPADTTDFTIDADLMHSELGWI